MLRGSAGAVRSLIAPGGLAAAVARPALAGLAVRARPFASAWQCPTKASTLGYTSTEPHAPPARIIKAADVARRSTLMAHSKIEHAIKHCDFKKQADRKLIVEVLNEAAAELSLATEAINETLVTEAVHKDHDV